MTKVKESKDKDGLAKYIVNRRVRQLISFNGYALSTVRSQFPWTYSPSSTILILQPKEELVSFATFVPVEVTKDRALAATLQHQNLRPMLEQSTH